MSASKYTLPCPVYLPSSGGYTSSRLSSEPFHRRVFAFRKYSVEEDGRLVARTRNGGHELPATFQSKNRDVPQASQDSLPRKQVEGAALSRLFQQLVPLTTDLSNFESKAAAICEAFDLDPTTSTEIISSFKHRLPADTSQRSNPSPPATSGPTISEPRPTDSLAPFRESIADPGPSINTGHSHAAPATTAEATSTPTPFKQQRPFSSGSPGFTTWYTTSSVDNITSPSPGITPEIGELYIHHNRVTDIHHVWLYGINRQWKCVTEQEKVYHPAIEDRVLSLRANGTPNWITTASFTTIRGRKGKARGGVPRSPGNGTLMKRALARASKRSMTPDLDILHHGSSSHVHHFPPFHYLSYMMSTGGTLDAEFEAIMAAVKNKPTPSRPKKVLHNPSGSNDGKSVSSSSGGYGPSRIHPRNERASPQPTIQTKYDTVVKGFKVLETSYDESQRKLTVAEERLSNVNASYNALNAEMEVAQQVLHDRETLQEINTLRNDVEASRAALQIREAEIGSLQKELEESKAALADREEARCYRLRRIQTEVEVILHCGICQSVTIEPFRMMLQYRLSTYVLCDLSLRMVEIEWTVCKNVPVRDRSNGLAFLIFNNFEEPIESFDANEFAELMVEIQEAEEIREAEETSGTDTEQEVMMVDYAFPEGAGTFADPMDLTALWN
ncbi:hypothetical protein BJ322DRAFT_1021987 [Thelephora terrestris]|uniref:Uncharacterized protein n=1 Tax=Thelephora terrestris TaxID=56493 RepID=A0A9P6HAZ5_9AGAM|nr:hypothetical protein BJ322DRAFT_1021987 [Thelephora terrestris]